MKAELAEESIYRAYVVKDGIRERADFSLLGWQFSSLYIVK